MTNQSIFANARLILNDDVVTGSLTIAGGFNNDIAQGAGVPKRGD
jgi:alpha-D-ribose 1-methylphosphonate 5-triphosphate diphosphatase